ncbi:DNA cytosine methyltransferase [Streptomyces sp. NBC_00233]|uniref:DNA cytosine methyltransferase n=1 Tax=Streptomyces sp. NBC_00233 TaxID=2975686 RepID=UPI002254472A|nr:DNA cytosine methyltransferase [Streptomyces sp. NBC_00233]
MTGDLRIGSLCTGYGGLDTAVRSVFGGSLAWVSDVDPGASRILAHHHPRVPNLGDLTAVDWAGVEPVDIVCGGYPCQPFSTAGKRKGTADARHIWPSIAHALRVLRPRYAVFENVAGHLRLGFDTVLRDLAAIGFDAEWCLVRASEVGAPHHRQRLFLLATPADPDHIGSDRRGARGAGRDEPAPHRHTAADAGGEGLEVRRVEPHRNERQAAQRGRRQRSADADPGGRRADDHHVRPGQPDLDWGRFAPAIVRWEAVVGRRAPGATDDRRRLNPTFVEWLMGLPAGHVTDVPGLTRTQQLKALGNGVVPQQAEAALRLLHHRAIT